MVCRRFGQTLQFFQRILFALPLGQEHADQNRRFAGDALATLHLCSTNVRHGGDGPPEKTGNKRNCKG